jgi:hypothetical protein
MNYLGMPQLTLSTGRRLLSEHVKRAEYFPSGSLTIAAMLNLGPTRKNKAAATHEQDFLYIRTVNGATHVRGGGAAQDATALEEAGVRVYRQPMP